MKSGIGLRLAISLAAATALGTPVLAVEPELLPERKRKKSEPHTPQEIKMAEAKPGYMRKPPQHPNVPSLKAMQHAGKHKNKGTPKGHPIKPR